MKSKTILATAGFFGATAVMLGAFAAHGLKKILSDYLIGVFETGVQYQFVHMLALILVAILLQRNLGEKAQKGLRFAAICFIIGILCFSGSLYALALTGIKWFGPITPFGGVMFIVGWVSFTIATLRIEEVKS
ncbi:putative SUGAR KINASE RELATED [Vibrio nigripulchritudo MADA3029]|uniref:DUF423 domain-containing protein n=1 Tax=Vibrio nigripulchritudo TaxID=28173 RepID=UPI0003B1CAF3|nr:DUF423 domain-containing protein [Vibrio nigripulchritudo]CCN46982.1 putative SUGAR KINASE RELATED [Vibrio nigripulchritudo MADA3020]CCN50925.1 putative SUGAR KINASE RELATED [Vibrio nigripulchritudo MADA3021]CCN60445.1 putative SUGAR KINASE RELATED [Vibrio nigripulchritudo MADA3029]